ncbi:MAG: efflux RND transporter periplasmic adaptor subunit, partial [Candidatus Saccharicenans sp.]|nr:efflux RND transporter periplasmic adaptor subunit [Candidatus Saccharicenans sp.]
MSKITRPVKGILIVLVICCLAAAGFWLYKKPDKEPSPSEESSPAATSSESQASSPLPVKATVVRVADLEKRIKSPGEAFTEKNVVLKAEVKGVLKKLNIREGQHVRTGEILAELDDTPYRLRLEQEEASRLKALSELLLDRLFQQPELADNSEDLLNVKKAEEAYLKAKQAFEEGLISQSELEKLRRDYELAMIGSGLKRDEIIASSKGLTQAEVNVKIAQMELEKTRITAPFSGVITQIRVAPGESIEAGREICTLVDLSQLKIEAKVLETVVGKIKTGREAYVN